MAFVLLVGILATATLSFSSSSLKAGPAYDTRSTAVQDIEGALQAAITETRTAVVDGSTTSEAYNFTDADPNCFPGGGTFGTPSTVRLYPASAVTSSYSSGGSNRVAVTCGPGPATGGMSELVPIQCTNPTDPSCNRPGNAILTMSTTNGSDEPGLQIDNRLLTVAGRIFSNSTIKLTGSSFCALTPQPPTRSSCVELYSKLPNWPVIARGNCYENSTVRSTHIISTPAAQCGYGSTANQYGNDPNYTAPDTALANLVLRKIQACTRGQETLQLLPGYYDDAAALSDWTDGNCSGSHTVILSPGSYYFDFHNAEMPASGTTAVPRQSDVWDISGNNVTVIGGQLTGGRTSGPIPSSAIPGACVSPLDVRTAQGVTLLFGGDSRIEYASGKVEFCGTYSGTRTPVVIQGAKADSASAAAAAPLAPAPTAATTPSGTTAFTTTPAGQVLTNLSASNESPTRKVATATLLRPSSNRATITGSVLLSGYSIPAGTIPAGSILTNASLTVVHQETGTSYRVFSFDDTLSVTVGSTRTGATATSTSITPTWGTAPAWTTDVVDLTSSLVQEAHDYGLTGLTVRYDAVAAGGTPSGIGSLATWSPKLDKVALNLTYQLPAVRSERTAIGGSANCVGTAPFVPGNGDRDGDEGGTNCALISTTSDGHRDERNIQGTFYVQGTVYAPYAAVELILPQQNKQAIRSGLIARSVRVNVRQEDARDHRDRPSQISIEVPNDSLGPLPVDVYYTAYTCPSGTTCTLTATGTLGTGWVKSGLTRVSFEDPTPFTPVASSRSVKVKSWQILR